MSIATLLKTLTVEIKAIIADLPAEFSSHHFIERFAQKFKSEYIDMLSANKDKGDFRIVHGQIARYLSVNQAEFGIHKTIKAQSENIFGDEDRIQWWKK